MTFLNICNIVRRMERSSYKYSERKKSAFEMRQVFFVAFLIFLAFLASKSQASEYSLYVDSHADSGGNGSKDEPFKDIEDAVKKADGGDVIYIANGNYDGGFTIPASVKLLGENRDGVVIKGSISSLNDSSLQNLTISGGNFALTVKAGSSVSVKKCTIKNASKIGINMEPGNGKLTLEDSKLTANRKGIYAQKGNQIRIYSSVITKNKEEGLDIRNKVDGTVKGNSITNNGESGIEVILGSSDLSIYDNYISDNSASGIAAQFYVDFGKKGKVKIDGNKIKNNNHYGIKCGAPSGGITPDGYWEKSLNLNSNTFGGNDEGDIAGRCKMTLDDESDESVKVAAAVAEKVMIEDPAKENAGEIVDDELIESDQNISASQIFTDEADFVKIGLGESGDLTGYDRWNLEKRYVFLRKAFGSNDEITPGSESGCFLARGDFHSWKSFWLASMFGVGNLRSVGTIDKQ